MDIRAGRDKTKALMMPPRTVRDQMKSAPNDQEAMRNTRDSVRPPKTHGKKRIAKRASARRSAQRRK
jgi:hypothetical protein